MFVLRAGLVLLVVRLVVVVVVLADRELIKESIVLVLVLFAERGEAGFLSLCCNFLLQEGVALARWVDALQEHVDEGTGAMAALDWAVMCCVQSSLCCLRRFSLSSSPSSSHQLLEKISRLGSDRIRQDLGVGSSWCWKSVLAKDLSIVSIVYKDSVRVVFRCTRLLKEGAVTVSILFSPWLGRSLQRMPLGH